MNSFQQQLPRVILIHITEKATGGVVYKMVFLKISQYSQENMCVGVSFW